MKGTFHDPNMPFYNIVQEIDIHIMYLLDNFTVFLFFCVFFRKQMGENQRNKAVDHEMDFYKSI